MSSRSTTCDGPFAATISELNSHLIETQLRQRDLKQLREDLITEQVSLQNELGSIKDVTAYNLTVELLDSGAGSSKTYSQHAGKRIPGPTIKVGAMFDTITNRGLFQTAMEALHECTKKLGAQVVIEDGSVNCNS
jgi:hypothetical protein